MCKHMVLGKQVLGNLDMLGRLDSSGTVGMKAKALDGLGKGVDYLGAGTGVDVRIVLQRQN